MAEYVYLIKNNDLYYIGRSESIEEVKKSFKPGILLSAMKSSDSKSILRILVSNYSEKRLPQSNYFRLTKSQAEECRKRLETGKSKDDFRPFFSGGTLITTLLISWISISCLIIKFGVEPIFSQFQ